MLRNQQVLAERDRQARARVEAEKEQSLSRVRAARERWEHEEQIARNAPRPAGIRAERLRAELGSADRAECCGAPMSGLEPNGVPSGKYVERHRRGIPTLGMPPSPACETAVRNSRLRGRIDRERKREREQVRAGE